MRNAVTIFDLRFGQNAHEKRKMLYRLVNQLVRRFFLEEKDILAVGTIYSRKNLVNTTYCEK